MKKKRGGRVGSPRSSSDGHSSQSTTRQKIPAKGATFERLVVDYLVDNALYIDSCRKSSSADWWRRLVCQICGVRPESLGLRWVATRAFLQFALCV